MTATNTKKRKLEDTSTSSFPPPFTNQTLKQRLRKGIMVQSGGQKGSLTRCLQKYALLTSGKEDKIREFQQELEWYRMDLTKAVLLQRNLTKEIQENHKVEEALEEEMEQLKEQVQESQQQAKRAKQVQSCFQEYEALSKLANTCLEVTNNGKNGKICSTGQLKEEIARVKQEIASNQQEETKLDEVLRVRKNQFHLLIQCMLDLKRSIDGEDDDEEEDGDDDDDEETKNTGKSDQVTAMDVDGNDNDDDDEEDGALDNDNLYGDLL